MKQNTITSPNEDAIYPMQPVPQSAQLQFKQFISQYIDEHQQINTPSQQGLDYWLSDPILNKLHYKYWDKTLQWQTKQQQFQNLNKQYANATERYNQQKNAYIRDEISVQITRIQARLNELLNLQSKLTSIKDQIALQLQSLIQIYNTSHAQSISNQQHNLIYNDILTKKPTHFSAKYYKTLPWDPDLVPDVDQFDPKKDYDLEDDQDNN